MLFTIFHVILLSVCTQSWLVLPQCSQYMQYVSSLRCRRDMLFHSRSYMRSTEKRYESHASGVRVSVWMSSIYLVTVCCVFKTNDVACFRFSHRRFRRISVDEPFGVNSWVDAAKYTHTHTPSALSFSSSPSFSTLCRHNKCHWCLLLSYYFRIDANADKMLQYEHSFGGGVGAVDGISLIWKRN